MFATVTHPTLSRQGVASAVEVDFMLITSGTMTSTPPGRRGVACSTIREGELCRGGARGLETVGRDWTPPGTPPYVAPMSQIIVARVLRALRPTLCRLSGGFLRLFDESFGGVIEPCSALRTSFTSGIVGRVGISSAPGSAFNVPVMSVCAGSGGDGTH